MRVSVLGLLSFALCIAFALCDYAKIVSCPACKLNSLPKLKKFLHGEEIKRYQGVSISWDRGKNPDLYIYDDEHNLKEKHDLSRMEVDAIKALLESRGFTQAPADL